MRQTNHFSYIVDGSHRVRSIADGHQLGAIRDLSRQVLHVESAVLIMNLGDADGYSAFLQSYPGREVGSMVQPRHHDFVTSSESQARKSAIAARAPAIMASVRWLVAKAPPVLALLPRK